MLHLYAALAEKERRLIAERTKWALAAKKPTAPLWAIPGTSTRLVLGRVRLTADADEFAANVPAHRSGSPCSGAKGYGSGAAALNRRGIRTLRGGRWHVSTFRDLLTRSVSS
jgi:hypothetical protein